MEEEALLKRIYLDPLGYTKAADNLDFEDVKGQEHARRGLEVAAAGSQNFLIAGPPGCLHSLPEGEI